MASRRNGGSSASGGLMATVDILIPCYRYGRFLEGCVRSILSQSMDDVRILIIDDASPDDSAQVARAIAASDQRVEVVAHAKNRGHIATYNEGIEWAESPFFLSLSADDYLAPFALERAAAIMEERPDVVMTYGACVNFFEGKDPPDFAGAAGDADWRVWAGRDFIKLHCERVRNLVPTPTAIVRTVTQKAIGGYLSTLPHAGDMEMWLRFAAHGAVAETPRVQAVYRIHGANMSVDYYKTVIRDYAQRRDVFEIFFANDGRRIDDADELHALARRRLAAAAFWTGVAQWCRGDRATGAEVLRLGLSLDPRMRLAPPVSQLLRLESPHRKLWSVLADASRRRDDRRARSPR